MPPPPPQLDVKKMIEPILRNYNEHILNLIQLLDTIQCTLIYEDSFIVRDHILHKKVYACSVSYHGDKKPKILSHVLPVMIGSHLDLAIRKLHLRQFTSTDLISPLLHNHAFETVDIISTYFIIGGFARQLPYFFTNDPTSTHVIKNSIVRCYSYDEDDRGKELSFYIDAVDHTYARGDLVVTLNNGDKVTDTSGFFSHCPYPIDSVPYMLRVHNFGHFDIDHLGNKIVVSPGHLFVKLFVKYLYVPLKNNDWKTARSKSIMVVKSIESGTLLHVLSRKTHYYKETESKPKMVHVPQENHRELGMNGEVYVEKNSGCYRDVNMQTYPLNPYLSHLILRQISSKVKTAVPYHPSYIGFLCIMGSFETKNVGRTNMMVRDTYVSTTNEMDSVAYPKKEEIGKRLYDALQLQPDAAASSSSSGRCVVINEACVRVATFENIDLLQLKRQFVYIECYEEDPFIYIRYKAGLFFKKMTDDVWVTPRDQPYWAQRLFQSTQVATLFGYHYLTGYHVDLNQFFQHSAFPKNIWAFNSLKNAILGTDPQYNQYFLETFSAYTHLSEHHRVVCPPADDDDFSKHFVLRLPQVTVAYMSFQGNNQEDSIVVRKDLNAFDCTRFYTVRVLLKNNSSSSDSLMFRPVVGPVEDNFLGTVSGNFTEAVSQSIHLRIVGKGQLYFKKPGFQVVEYQIVENKQLILSIERFHKASMGDKLCSFFGQKGLMRFAEGPKMPVFDGTVEPDLILNPYCLFRMTPGQIIEAIELGGGKDAETVHNSEGVLIEGASVFYGKTYYFLVGFLSDEHIYIPRHYIKDKVLNQPVKGRSREGGMRLGTMEMNNGLRGNGLAACFEEKFLEHGDRIIKDGVVLPKSALLCEEDAKFFKVNLGIAETIPAIQEIDKSKN